MQLVVLRLSCEGPFSRPQRGIEKGDGETLQQAWQAIVALPHADPRTFGVRLGALALIFLPGALASQIPAALVVFVPRILAVQLFGLDRHEVLRLLAECRPTCTLHAYGRLCRSAQPRINYTEPVRELRFIHTSPA